MFYGRIIELMQTVVKHILNILGLKGLCFVTVEASRRHR